MAEGGSLQNQLMSKPPWSADQLPQPQKIPAHLTFKNCLSLCLSTFLPDPGFFHTFIKFSHCLEFLLIFSLAIPSASVQQHPLLGKESLTMGRLVIGRSLQTYQLYICKNLQDLCKVQFSSILLPQGTSLLLLGGFLLWGSAEQLLSVHYEAFPKLQHQFTILQHLLSDLNEDVVSASEIPQLDK